MTLQEICSVYVEKVLDVVGVDPVGSKRLGEQTTLHVKT